MGEEGGRREQVKGWLSGAAMLDAKAEAQHILTSISLIPKYREVSDLAEGKPDGSLPI